MRMPASDATRADTQLGDAARELTRSWQEVKPTRAKAVSTLVMSLA